MTRKFAYVVAEGVLDVVFLTQVLRTLFGASQISQKQNLPASAALWIDGFKWPVANDIKRMSVPAPVFVQSESWIFGMRNAGGLEKIRATMTADFEQFLRIDWHPDSVAIILDADDQAPAARFQAFSGLITERGFPAPIGLESIAESGPKRAGIFGFPGGGAAGTIEDVLLPIAESRFSDLHRHTATHVDTWQPMGNVDFAELSRPSGRKKARLSSMAALLKPGKPLNSSLEDQHWLPSDISTCQPISSLVAFLQALCPHPTIPVEIPAEPRPPRSIELPS